ncbi:hypothetical protein L2E82_03275 [Cichorium intybus]|uniref:Uncharacterized protein n=1 Tax=Cichorium intybus TaxID=13427 RepID=A0ACB9H3L0_CICIN|nr:hypothetical protein L2E82_03275 [Cichorium intybus]
MTRPDKPVVGRPWPEQPLLLCIWANRKDIRAVKTSLPAAISPSFISDSKAPTLQNKSHTTDSTAALPRIRVPPCSIFSFQLSNQVSNMCENFAKACN